MIIGLRAKLFLIYLKVYLILLSFLDMEMAQLFENHAYGKQRPIYHTT